ncbi:MAG: calpain [Myxococcota bacterium]
MPQEFTIEAIQKHVQKAGRPWEDPDFPAVDASIFYSKASSRSLEWKRPKDITQNPQMFVGGGTRMDIEQGALGNNWLLAAIAGLAQHSSRLHRVVPEGQPLDGPGYCGAVKFNFWQAGRWVEVIVDDRLPTYNGRLVFLHSSEANEYWSALLEKAYAKLMGSYEALKGGQTSEAMVDLNGGIAEVFELDKAPDDFFEYLLQASKRQCLMGCSISAAPHQVEAKLESGLVKGHAYTITGVNRVSARTRRGSVEVDLVRIRNPWGNEREWTGAWSDRSQEWVLLSDTEKHELGVTYDDDGEFWMSYEDFARHFTRVEIGRLVPHTELGWEAHAWHGSWRKSISAGGCRNFPDTFYLNPQYRVTLNAVDDREPSLVVSLLQKNRRQQKHAGVENLTIGFAIYKLADDFEQYEDNGRMSKDYFLYHKSAARSHAFINAREITTRFRLSPGEYVIVPSTFDKDEEGEFLLRVYVESRSGAVGEGASSAPAESKSSPAAGDTEVDQKFQAFFDKLAGQDREIDPKELVEMLTPAFKKELDGREVDIHACRALIRYVERDHTGKLNVQEFKSLWTILRSWVGDFKKHDGDRSSQLSIYEFRDLLESSGIPASQPSIERIMTWAGGTMGLSNYLYCMACLHRAKETFTPDAGSNRMSLSVEEWLFRQF